MSQERKLIFVVSVYDDWDEPESFAQRTNKVIQAFGAECESLGLYYGGHSSFKEIELDEWK